MLKYVLIIIFSILLGQLLLWQQPMSLVAVVLFVVFPIFIIKPHLYFLGFVILRPLIDVTIKSGLQETYLSSLVVIPLIVLCFKDIFFNRKYLFKIMKNPFLRTFNAFFTVFILIALISMLNTTEIKASLADFVRLISLIISVNYAVVFFGTERGGLKRFMTLVFFSSLIPMAFGIYQFLTGTGITEGGLNRIYGTFAHSNVFAEYLFLLIFMLIFYFGRMERKGSKKRLGLVLLLLMTAFCFYNTYTRTLWIAFGVSFLFYVLMKRSLVKKIAYLLVATCLVFLSASTIHHLFYEKRTKQEGRSSWEWRTELWEGTIQQIKENPIIGHGLGSFEHDSTVMAHNDFLRLSYETGLPGAVVFYSLFVYLLVISLWRAAHAKLDYEKDQFYLAFCLSLGLLIASMAVNTLRSTIIMFYFLITVALLIQSKKREGELSYENSLNQ